jgi:hypothetical protein
MSSCPWSWPLIWCTDSHFAMVELYLPLAMFAQHYCLGLLPGRPIEPKPCIGQ